ncbi:MAG: hypothetical protein PHF86_05620 [Candidatus Nanoarchaeia archaeon]|nr:hypothetical protein [Candidatus Nanoarchaeia archaeon]
MNIYETILIILACVMGFLFLTRNRNNKFDKEYHDLVNSEKYKVKGQY